MATEYDLGNVMGQQGIQGIQGIQGEKGDPASVNGILPDDTGNITLSALDVHARPDTWMPTADDVGAAIASGATAVKADGYYNLTLHSLPPKLPEIFSVSFTLPEDYVAGDKIRIEGVPHLVNLYGKGYMESAKNLSLDRLNTKMTNGFVAFGFGSTNGGAIVSNIGFNKAILKPNTQHTIIAEITKNTRTGSGHLDFAIIQATDIWGTLDGGFLRIQGNQIGTYKKRGITKTDLSNTNIIRTYIVPEAGKPESGEIVARAMLIEGDYTTTDLPADYWEDTFGEYDLSSYAGTLTTGSLKKGQTATVTINTASSTAYVSGEGLLEDQIADLRAYVGYTETDIVGLEADFKNSKFTRLAGAVGKTEGDDFSSMRAFNRRRCILADDGTVLAYYGETGYTETGKTAQVFTINEVVYPIGAPAQVMVEQLSFYYKVVPLELEPIQGGIGHHMRKARYYISDTPRAGFKLHPAFITNGVERDKVYLSAYEGCIWDESASNYILNDAQIADFTADKLSSIANAKPASGLTQLLTRSNTRLLAQKRGAGWQQETGQAACATELLFLVEYASFNMQEKIGLGVTNKPSGEGSKSEITGATFNLGNATGAVTNENGFKVITYRGEENFYGNIWKFIDGFNINAKGIHEVYVADSGFIDDKITDNYKNAGITLAKTNGYVSAFGYNEPYDWLFFASETLGTSALPVGDYFYQKNTYNGIAIALLGGLWADGVNAGGFYWHVSNVSGYRARYVGGRLVYVPQN